MFIGINIILSTSLNLVNGYMGEFSVGHAGFMAVGAYITSVLNVWFFTSSSVFGPALLSPSSAIYLFPLTLLIGGVGAALAGLLVAVPSFRTRGDYLAIITLAVNYIVKSSIENIQVIGGARGFMGMRNVVNGMQEAVDLPWMLIWVLIAVGVTVWIIHRFVNSTYGKGIVAVRDDEIAAEIMSVNTQRMKMMAFMLSSGLAGIAGGPFRPHSRLHQSGDVYHHEIHRSPGDGLPRRDGIAQRIGAERHRLHADPRAFAAPPGGQVGRGPAAAHSSHAVSARRHHGPSRAAPTFSRACADLFTAGEAERKCPLLEIQGISLIFSAGLRAVYDFQSDAEGRRTDGAHRPQRRRQDHRVQPGLRVLPAQRREKSCFRGKTSSGCGPIGSPPWAWRAPSRTSGSGTA